MRLGVFGGTFNPIHLGHLHLAGKARSLFGLHEVHFVVAATPPHKPLEGLAPLIHRHAMVALATSSHDAFIPSLVELENPVSPFSLHTMEKLARRCEGKGKDLYFIAGGDSLLEVAGWHQSEKLLDDFNFVFIARPGTCARDASLAFPERLHPRIHDLRGLEPDHLTSRARQESDSNLPGIFLIDAGAPDISSSRIREMIAARISIDALVPGEISRYIQKLHLYGER
jgi:nicotinate-nucleotide adenylyltransferase